MELSHPKIRFLLDTACVDSEAVLRAFRQRYPLLPYCGFYQIHKKVYLYVHHTQRLSAAQLCKILSNIKPPPKIKEISKFSKIEGVPVDETGTRPVHGGGGKFSSGARADPISNTDDTDDTDNISNKKKIVNVNAFGHESLEHITLDFILNLLSQKLGWVVLCEFAGELYGLEQNMNFRLRIKERYIKTRVGADGAWLTSLKKSEYETMLLNLVQKNREAVDAFRDSIPVDDLKCFEETLVQIEAHRQARGSEARDDYDRFATDGINIIGENISEVVKRKKLKLV